MGCVRTRNLRKGDGRERGKKRERYGSKETLKEMTYTARVRRVFRVQMPPNAFFSAKKPKITPKLIKSFPQVQNLPEFFCLRPLDGGRDGGNKGEMI